MSENPAHYFKRYREQLGYSSQVKAKEFLAAKDIRADIDYRYIDLLAERISVILTSLNGAIHESLRHKNLPAFVDQFITTPQRIIREAGLLRHLNNQGRRPEEVFFAWLRGYTIVEYFVPIIARIFGVQAAVIQRIGEDDLRNGDTFKRSPTADLSVSVFDATMRLEVQSGFQGINDIKEHKVREARRVYAQNSEGTVCIHVDLFNGQAAFVRLDAIAEDDVHFVTRQQMEGQSVFSIDQNFFKWRLLDPPPLLDELEIR